MAFKMPVPKVEDLIIDGGGWLAFRNYGYKAIVYRRPTAAGARGQSDYEQIVVANGFVIQHTVHKGLQPIHHCFHSHLSGNYAFGLDLKGHGFYIHNSYNLAEYMEMTK